MKTVLCRGARQEKVVYISPLERNAGGRGLERDADAR